MTYKSISISGKNYDDLMAIAAQLSDILHIPVSANSALTVVLKEYKKSDHIGNVINNESVNGD